MPIYLHALLDPLHPSAMLAVEQSAVVAGGSDARRTIAVRRLSRLPLLHKNWYSMGSVRCSAVDIILNYDGTDNIIGGTLNML